MKRIGLAIELLDDAVFSATAATEGGHVGLDRIPGSALLGVAAARLYQELGEVAFTAFHSGRIRFGDGLPDTAAGPAWPMPLCWHRDKLKDPVKEGRLLADRLTNFLHTQRLPGGEERQPKQMRTGYVAADGAYVRPRSATRLKTAIDPATGRVAGGQLFGYQALLRGQSFIATLEADDTVDEALWERIQGALIGEVILGRSRSAEYGRARIRAIAPPVWEAGEGRPGEAVLWLLSDLALADEDGLPVLQPEGRHFGLPGARVDWSRTFLRSRRYSPWNAARHGYDQEREVLTAGGVITLTGVDEGDRQALLRRLEGGWGLYREGGLGRIWVDPPLLATPQPEFESGPEPASSAVPPRRPEHPLVAWLEGGDESWKGEGEQAAVDFESDYRRLMQAARRLAAVVGEDEVFGPSKSQWGAVLECAREADSADTLLERLFQGDGAVVKPKGEGWNVQVRNEEGSFQPLARWLQQRLRTEAQRFTSDRTFLHFVRVAARRIQDHLERRTV